MLAGLIPFVAGSVLLWITMMSDIIYALKVYCAIILSFMAGTHWGIIMACPDTPNGKILLLISNVVAVIVWFGLLSPVPTMVFHIAVVGFIIQLYLDTTMLKDTLPGWYLNLRKYVTVAVLFSLVIAIVGLNRVEIITI